MHQPCHVGRPCWPDPCRRRRKACRHHPACMGRWCSRVEARPRGLNQLDKALQSKILVLQPCRPRSLEDRASLFLTSSPSSYSRCWPEPERSVLATHEPKRGSPRGLQGKEMTVPSRQRGPVGSIRDLIPQVRLEWAGPGWRPGALTRRKRGRAVSARAGSSPAAGCRCHSAPGRPEVRHPRRHPEVGLIPTPIAVLRFFPPSSQRGARTGHAKTPCARIRGRLCD